MARRRIGLLGGSFDPVHLAHLQLARCALDALQLDELRWVPAGAPWQKGGLTDAEHRAAMVRAAIEGQPRQVIDSCEIDRAGPTYTIDTVRALQQPDVEIFLVIGQDQYARLDTWHRWEELLPLVTWAVAARSGQPVHAPPAVAARQPRVVALVMPAMDVSATELRARAARGEPLEDWVPPAVARYIAAHGLYRPDSTREPTKD